MSLVSLAMVACRPGVALTPAIEPEREWFVEATADCGLAPTAERTPVATSTTAADLDGDGWVDFFAATFPSQRDPDAKARGLFMNRPHPTDPSRRVFVDIIARSGLLATEDGQNGRGITAVSLGDLDNDGDVDLIGCPAEISPAIEDGCAAFLNDGAARFSLVRGGDLSREVFSVPSLALLDYDRDGILDLWPATVGQWQYGPAATSPVRLLRGRGDGLFDEVSLDVGLPPEPFTDLDYRMAFGVTACDVDSDGDSDVLVGQYGVPIGPNHLWRNDGGRFVDVARELGVDRADQGGFTCSITCGDLDDDGDMDLMTSEIAHPGQGTDPSALLLNVTSPGEALAPFQRVSLDSVGIVRSPGEMEGDQLALFADLDLDGRKDVIVSASNYPQRDEHDTQYTHTSVFQQTGLLAFRDVSARTPFLLPQHQSLEGGSLLDYDNDGDLDFVTGTGLFNSAFIASAYGTKTHALRLYRNEIGQERHWIRVRLVGRGKGGSNASGIGARVTVITALQAQHQELIGSFGHSDTQSDLALTFGLGEATHVDAIEVRWPNAEGLVSRWEDIAADREVTLLEGARAPVYRGR